MGFREFLKNAADEAFLNFLQKSKQSISRGIEIEIWKFKKKMFKDLFSIFVIMLGVMSLLLSGLFAMIEFLNFSKTLSFLIIGIIFLIIGIIIKI